MSPAADIASYVGNMRVAVVGTNTGSINGDVVVQHIFAA